MTVAQRGRQAPEGSARRASHRVERNPDPGGAPASAELDALQQRADRAEAALADRNHFVAAASHDLRQPMHALALFATALEKGLRGTPHHPTIVRMVQAIEDLEDLFGAVLDLARLEAGGGAPQCVAFPLADLFRRVHAHCAPQAEARGLALRLRPGGRWVLGDPRRLEQVLLNLVANAIRYTETGGVAVVARRRGDSVRIEVHDTGIGIATDDLSAVFDEFRQVGVSTGGERTGSGLGLAIVRRLVALLGHELDVTSTPGRGSVFRLSVPAAAVHDTGSCPDATTPSDDDALTWPGGARTILVIDDNEPVRRGTAGLLAAWGLMAITACSADDAVRVARSLAGRVDAIVAGLHLRPGPDGLAAIAEVRAACGVRLPALLVTGDSASAGAARARAQGHLVLVKPVRPQVLRTALRTLLTGPGTIATAAAA